MKRSAITLAKYNNNNNGNDNNDDKRKLIEWKKNKYNGRENLHEINLHILIKIQKHYTTKIRYQNNTFKTPACIGSDSESWHQNSLKPT